MLTITGKNNAVQGGAKNHLQQAIFPSWQNHPSRKKAMATISNFPEMTSGGSYPDYLSMDTIQSSLLATGFWTTPVTFFFHNGKTLCLIDRLEGILNTLKSGINKRKGHNVCLWLGKQYLGRKKPLWSKNDAIYIVLSMVKVQQNIPLQLKVWR